MNERARPSDAADEASARAESDGAKRAIIVVDHGSRRAAANDMLAALAALVERAAPDYHVEWAHMELAPPSIADAFDRSVEAGATDITIHPYMLSPGRHATEDIPRLAAEAASRHPGVEWRVTAPLGIDRRLAELVVSRVAEARADRPEVGRLP